MKDFVLIFRLNNIADFKPTAEQMQERMNWLAGIASQNKLADKGNTLLPIVGSAKTIKADTVVTAENIDEAVEMAKANPIFEQVGGSIEVREVLKRD